MKNDLIGKEFKAITKYGLSLFTSTITDVAFTYVHKEINNIHTLKVICQVKGRNNWYYLDDVVLVVREKYVSPNDGGCWFCHTNEGEMYFDFEFDTYVHLECVVKALLENKEHSEGVYMTYLLDESMFEFPKVTPPICDGTFSKLLVLKDINDEYHIGVYHWFIGGNYFITRDEKDFGEHYIKGWKYLNSSDNSDIKISGA